MKQEVEDSCIGINSNMNSIGSIRLELYNTIHDGMSDLSPQVGEILYNELMFSISGLRYISITAAYINFLWWM